MDVGALEDQFFAKLAALLDLPEHYLDQRWDKNVWPALGETMEARFARETRDAWCAREDAAEACLSPVLTFAESLDHPHAAARAIFPSVGGLRQPRPYAGLGGAPAPPPTNAAHARDVLAGLGYGPAEMERLAKSGAVSL